MARLAAIEKGLYYPTPERVTQLITQVVVPRVAPAPWNSAGRVGVVRIFDPCAGEGTAAATLALAWGGEAWGVELEADRAQAAATVMRCLHGSYHQLAAEAGAFNVLFLNPPYDYGEADGKTMRQEAIFLRDCSRWLCDGGLLVAVVPRRILGNGAFVTTLERAYHQWMVYAFPDPEVRAFDQVVLLARRTSKSSWWSAFKVPATMPALSACVRYGPPGSTLLHGDGVSALTVPWVPDTVVGWELRGTAPELYAPRYGVEGAPATGAYGTEAWDVLAGERESLLFRPLVTPRPGHQAMLLAAGALNGTELPGGVLIRGGTMKVTSTSVDMEGRTETVRERIVSRLSTFDVSTGEYRTWRADEDKDRTKQWFDDHGPTLAAAIASSYEPAFDGDLTPYRARIDALTPPGVLPGHDRPLFFRQQEESAAAIAFWWRRDKYALLGGEMGVGKTSIAIMACALAGATKVVVVCPSHLVPKWVRECETILGQKGVAATARRVVEVDAFFADDVARFLVVSKEMAKLGARWEPCIVPRTYRVSREVRVDSPPGSPWWHQEFRTEYSTKHVAACPRCGTVQVDENGGKITVAAFRKGRKRLRCAVKECREALWQATPISAKGTKRWPLARYVQQRYRGRYYLVADEAHAFVHAETDQTQALHHLHVGARRTLEMTGTIYSGRASSLFSLLYRNDPSFRQVYGFREVSRFVAHHGLFQTKRDVEETTSLYGYRRGNTGGRVREVPGMSPAMVPMLLPRTVFVKLKDLEAELPPYTEEVVLLPHRPDVYKAARDMASSVRSVLRRYPRVLGAYLMACLGYPDRPEEPEEIYGTDDQGVPLLLADAPALQLGERELWPKDEYLLDRVRAEVDEGRRVLVYVAQPHRRDVRPRLRALLESDGFAVEVLGAEVAPDKREAWLHQRFPVGGGGADVLITNGRLVETGMDLLFASTIIQYGIEYSINTLRQSVRRSWRLGQAHPVRVVYLGYQGGMQEVALDLIARKMRAAELVDGDEVGGLAQHDEEGADFFTELAQATIGSSWDDGDE